MSSSRSRQTSKLKAEYAFSYANEADASDGKITDMRARVRELEAALSTSYASHTADVHPLLREEWLAIASSADETAMSVDNTQSASGVYRHHSWSSEVCSMCSITILIDNLF